MTADHRYYHEFIPNSSFSSKVTKSSNINNSSSLMGTVGCVVCYNNCLASATSTGGTSKKMCGRTGDSPIIGAGNYADNNTAAFSCTGTGEEFLRHCTAYDCHARIKYSHVNIQQAMDSHLQQMLKNKSGGIIGIDCNGNVGYSYTLSFLLRGYFSSDSNTAKIGIWEQDIEIDLNEPIIEPLSTTNLNMKQALNSMSVYENDMKQNIMGNNNNRAPVLLLFDVDGTLTKRQQKIEPFMVQLLEKAKKQVFIGIVGGSALLKQQEQLCSLSDDIRLYFDYVFSQNGLDAYKNGSVINSQSIVKELGEETLQIFINWALKYLSELKLPVKRGTFLEFRSGMINISPIGSNCSQSERLAFNKLDAEINIRQTMIDAFVKDLPELAEKMRCTIGGQISFDVFPHGWDKSFCLQFLNESEFKEIHFFGDMTNKGGNDYELYEHQRTIGHEVNEPKDTERIVNQILQGLK